MRFGWIVAGAMCLGPAASAQEPPKETPKEPPAEGTVARHVNRVSEAARAAFEKISNLLASPLKGGLKDLEGAVRMELEAGPAGEGTGARMGAMGKLDLVFAVRFRAPSDLRVELVDAPGRADAEKSGEGMGARMLKGLGEGMGIAVTRLLRATLEGFVPATDSEYDADLKVENGVSTILLTTYRQGVETSREEITLDGNGIPSVLVSTPKAGEGRPRAADGKSTVKLSWAKEGDLFRLETMTLDGPRGPLEARLEYADAGKFRVVRSWEMASPGGGMKFAFRFSELKVNGEPVALPGEAPGGGGKPGEGKGEEPPPGKGG